MLAIVICVALAGVVLWDLTQKRHAILRNFPIIGHFRYLLESIGPELRQYIVTGNNEERPFSRDERRWVYATSKLENSYFGFGTDDELETSPSYLIIKHRTLGQPSDPMPHFGPDSAIPCSKVLGAFRGRRGAFRPASIVNVSGMSFGSISGPAVEAINRGCAMAKCLHNTGEGGIGPAHAHGGELVLQIGTGYFGCRDAQGRFSLPRLEEVVARHAVRAIEIKLSQGAKPGMGGVLPKAKVSAEIAAARGVPVGQDCVSPSGHAEFNDVDSMLDFVERVADATGLPVGVKSAVGEMSFWRELADAMRDTHRGVDFITIDGGEGGTGAAPLVFADHVALPFKIGFSRVYRTFAERGMHERVVFIGSGKLGFPENALLGIGLGCDLLAVAREAMLSIGCIQATRCHTGRCPAGIATQNRWLTRGLDPDHKSVRLANYVITLRKELMRLARACGEPHPALVSVDRLELIDDRFSGRTVADVFGYEKGWGLPSAADRQALLDLAMAPSDAQPRPAS